MFIAVLVICLFLLLLALAGVDMIVSNINPDELNNMGIEKKA